MKPYARAERVGGLIREILSDILRRRIKDPRLERVLITGVRMSPDLKIARIYFSDPSGPDGAERILKGFASASGFIKRSLSRELDLRYMPELSFFYDESIDYGAHIEALFKSIHLENGPDYSQTENE